MSKDIHNISTQTYCPTTCPDFGCQSKISSEFLNPKISLLMKFNALVLLRTSLILLFSIFSFSLAAQTTFTVTNTNDSGTGSLRQAILDANANAGSDVVDMSSISGTINLTSSLSITESLIINGSGEDALSVSGQNLHRPFVISSGTITFQNFSIIDGYAKGGDGTGTRYGGGGGAGMGGALITGENVVLVLEDMTFDGNVAEGGAGGGCLDCGLTADPPGAGGASFFSGSPATPGGSGGFGAGGSSGRHAILNLNGTTGGNGGFGGGSGGAGIDAVSFISGAAGAAGKHGGSGAIYTFSGNDAGQGAGGGGAGLGGAIFFRGTSITIRNSTFNNNTAVRGNAIFSSESNILNNLPENGSGKGGAFFIYSEIGNEPTYTLDGIIYGNNNANDAGSSDADNHDIFLEDGLTFIDNTILGIKRSLPENESTSYVDATNIQVWFNEVAFADASQTPLDNNNIASKILFREKILQTPVNFTATVSLNNVSIGPAESLDPNKEYEVIFQNIFDHDGNSPTLVPITFSRDIVEPSFVSNPGNGQLLTQRTFILTADESIFNTDGSAITNGDLSSILAITQDDGMGATIPYTATIFDRTITVSVDDPVADQVLHVAINDVEDIAGNELLVAETFTLTSPSGISLTPDPSDGGTIGKRLYAIQANEMLYDTDNSILGDADLAAKILLRENNMSGADVAFDAFLEGNNIYIASNALDPSMTYWVSIQDIEDVTGIEIPQTTFTFNTSSLFNPVSGAGFAANFADGEVSTDDIALAGDFTIEAWINTSDSDGLIAGNDMASGLIEFGITAGKLSLGDGTTTVSSTASIDDGMWHHVAASLSGTTVQLYIDGVADGSGTITVTSRKINRLGKGYQGGLTNAFEGSLDEVRIWNSAVSSTNISSNRSSSLNGSNPDIANLAAYFSLDESVGTFTHDYNGNLVQGMLLGDFTWEVSGVNFPAPALEITVDAVPVAFEGTYDFGSLGLNSTSTIKTFQIENTGTVDLLLRGNPIIELTGPSASEFTLDQTGISTALAPSGTTTFTVSFTPTTAGFREAEIVIENGSINDPYRIKLEGTGLDITTNGDWDFVGGSPGVIPLMTSASAHDGEFYVAYNDLSGGSTNRQLAKLVGEEFQNIGAFDGSGNNMEISPGGRIFTFSTNDVNTATSVRETSISAGSTTTFFNFNFSINNASAFEDRTRFAIAFDGTKSYAAYSYADDGNVLSMHGIKIDELVSGGSTSNLATLTRADLVNSGNTDWNIFAYDIAFDASDNLWVAARTRISTQAELFLAKYDGSWTVYDLSATPGLQVTNFVALEFDSNNDMHIANMGAGNTVHYIKVNTAGTVLTSDFVNTFTTFNSQIQETGTVGGLGSIPLAAFGLGTDDKAIFTYVDSNTNRPKALKYDNGMFNEFSEEFIVPDQVNIGSSDPFNFSVDPVSGRAYLAYTTTTVSSLNGALQSVVSTNPIVPEITVSVDNKTIQSGAQLLLQSGVGFEKQITLKLSNSGVTGLELTGDPIIEFSGTNIGDLSYDLTGLSSSLAAGEFIEIPISFTPQSPFDEIVTLTIPDNTPAGETTVSIQLSGLDPSNSDGSWEEYSSVNSSFNSVDMTIIDGKPLWAQNIFTQLNAQPNPNNGGALEHFEIMELHTYDLYTAGNTTPEAIVQAFNSDPTMAADWTVQDVATDYFQKIRMVKNPTTSSATVLASRPYQDDHMGTPFDNWDPKMWLENGSDFNFIALNGFRGGYMDGEIDTEGDVYYSYVNFHPTTGYDIVVHKGTQTVGNNVFRLQNVGSADTDLDMELDGNDIYLTYGVGNTLQVVTQLKTANNLLTATNILNQSDVLILPSSEARTKDLEFSSAGDLWLAYIENSTSDVRVKSYDGTGSNWTDLPAIDYETIIVNAQAVDVQLQIHPDGTPYVSAVVDGQTGQTGIAAIHRFRNGSWELVGNTVGFGYQGSTFDGNSTSAAYNIQKAIFRLTDQGKPYLLAGDKVYTINILPDDFDQIPEFTSTSPVASVDEEVTYTYNIVTDDADAGNALTITAANVPAWLTFTDNGDRTATLAGTPMDKDVDNYEITLTVSDGIIDVDQVVNLEVINVDNDPDFFIEDVIYYMDESQLARSIDISGITDGDEPLEQTLTFSVTSDNTALINDQTVNYTQGSETATLDFTHAPDMNGDANLTVRLEDDGMLFKEMVVRANVVAGDVFLVASNSNGTLIFDEDVAIGTELALAFASDVDFDETYTFELVTGTGDTNNNLFNLVGNSLQTAGAMDFETLSTPSIRLQGDNGAGAVYERVFVLSINDVPEDPTDFTLSSTSIDEAQPIGTAVGTFSAVDEDDANVHTYTLVSGFGDNASFQIDGEELQVAEVFDFDVKNSFDIQVELADNGVILIRDFTITVNQPTTGNPQVITFDPPAVVYIDETPVVLEATSDSGLEVEFEIVSGSEFANISGDNLNLVAAGIIEVAAKQPGNETFDAAEDVRATIEIKPVFTISGRVTDENDAAFSTGTATLVVAGETQGPGVSLASDGTYSFTAVREGTYYLGVVPADQEAYYTTAFGGAIIYQDATPVVVSTADLTNMDIQMIERPATNPLNGNGVITGRVINDDGQGSRITNGRILEGDPVEGASIFLIRKSDNEILTEVFSDANGDFEISGIPDGTYDILINIPGVAGTISQEVTIAEGAELLMTAMVGDEGIVFEVETVLGVDEIIDFKVYPNPVSDILNVELKGESELIIRDMQGRMLIQKQFKDQMRINIGNLSEGMYLMELHQEDKILRGKLNKKN